MTDHSETLSEGIYNIDDFFPDLTYDEDLPQEWANAVQQRGLDPRGHVVWAYPKGYLMGYPMPKDGVGITILGKLAVRV
jgi:hypothetical protein